MNIALILLIILFSMYSTVTIVDATEINVEIVAENLEIPWSIDFASNGKIFFSERNGNIRVIENGILKPEPIFALDVAGGEGGLLGIVLDPNFEKNHYIYIYYTYSDFLSTYNKVVRYTESNNKLLDAKILIDKIPGAWNHDGGRLKFGPDEKLYITTGDAGNTRLSQDLESLGGKILRINSDGTIPNDNPFENSLVYTYGHRNPQGLAWNENGDLYSSEHGPSGEKGFAHDEINKIVAGKNYGWPNISGDEADFRYISPIFHTGDETWAPSGVTFYNSNEISEWNGKFFVATLRGAHLRVMGFTDDGNSVISSEALFENEYGRLRDVVEGPNGSLYILTSNQDGRGSPAPNDDKILKITSLSRHDLILGDSSLSPLRQLAIGVLPYDILCKSEMILLMKPTSERPVCVYQHTAEKLVPHGWDVVS